MFSKYLEFAINKVITYIPNPIVINGTALDMSLIKSPQIVGEYLPIQVVGKFSPVNKELPFDNPSTMPEFYKDGESIQIFISEFSLKSFLYTMMELGKLKVIIDNSPLPLIMKFDTWYFSFFIPNIGKTYGYNSTVRLVAYVVENPPEVLITPENVQVNVTFNLNIEVFDNGQWVRAVVFRMHAKVITFIKIQNDLEFFMNIENIILKIDSVIESNIGQVNISMFNTFVFVMSRIIEYSVNLIFKYGIHIDEYVPFKISFNIVEFKLFEDFMVLQATPEFHFDDILKNVSSFIQNELPSTNLNADVFINSTEFKKIVNKEFLKVIKTYKLDEMLMSSNLHNKFASLENYKVFEQLFTAQSKRTAK